MGEPGHRITRSEPVPPPSPEHQRRISRQKWFEIVTVVLLAAAGFGYLGWRNSRLQYHTDPVRTLAESVKAAEMAGGSSVGASVMFDRQFLTLSQKSDSFDCHIDLIGESAEAPLETAVIWLTPLSGKGFPSSESLQRAVNAVGMLAQTLVRSSSDALGKASKTMVYVSDTKRPHDKGVAGTSDGWKVTYVTYRAFDENADPEPVLCLILQRLSAGSSPELADFNRTLYEAVHQGIDVKSALRSASATKPIE